MNIYLVLLFPKNKDSQQEVNPRPKCCKNRPCYHSLQMLCIASFFNIALAISIVFDRWSVRRDTTLRDFPCLCL